MVDVAEWRGGSQRPYDDCNLVTRLDAGHANRRDQYRHSTPADGINGSQELRSRT
jgi:hypothetical protein